MKKWLALLAGCLFGLFVVGLLVAYRIGAFNRVQLSREERGPYRIVCLSHRGAYNKIKAKILAVEAMLKEAGVERVAPCGVYYDNPAEVPEEELSSKGGFVVRGEVAVDGAFEIVEIPRREVLWARFEGHPSVAPVKIYPEMAAWLADHGWRRGSPVIEFYRPGRIECEMPIERPAP